MDVAFVAVVIVALAPIVAMVVALVVAIIVAHFQNRMNESNEAFLFPM